MTRVKQNRWLVMAAAVLGAMVLGTCGDSKSCVPANCVSGALMHIVLDTRPCSAPCISQRLGGPLTVCRNSECYSTVLPDVAPAGGAESDLFFADTTVVVGALWQNADQTTSIDIEWRLNADQVANGDHYVVTWGSPVATTLLDEVATYSPTQPVADQCASDPVCQIAELSP